MFGFRGYIDIRAMALIGALAICQGIAAQRDTQHAVTFGIGRTNYYDTYLSPKEYAGPQITVMGETMRTLKRNKHITFQSITQGQLAYTDNSTNNGNEFGGGITYDAGWFYTWRNLLLPGLDILAGGQAEGRAGFLYNNRNTNNPAQAYANARLNISASAIYRFNIRRHQVVVRYQVATPIVGGMFTPNYGQSYYEIFSQGDYDKNIVFTHPGTNLCVTQMLSADIPVGHAKLRLGYVSDLQQAKVHSLRQHHFSRSFMIGYVRELTIK